MRRLCQVFEQLLQEMVYWETSCRWYLVGSEPGYPYHARAACATCLILPPNTCAPSVREWYHTRSPGENILHLKKGHNTLYTAFGERISQNTHRRLI